MRTNTHYYSGSMPCGCVCALVVDEVDYPADTAESIAEFITLGYTVVRLPLPGSFTRCAAHAGLGPHAWRGAMQDQREAAKTGVRS